MENQTDKRVVLLIAAMASFLTPFMLSAVNVALPQIGREFNMDEWIEQLDSAGTEGEEG